MTKIRLKNTPRGNLLLHFYNENDFINWFSGIAGMESENELYNGYVHLCTIYPNEITKIIEKFKIKEQFVKITVL